MPKNTVYVGRGSVYGNPFVVGTYIHVGGFTIDARLAVNYYRMFLDGRFDVFDRRNHDEAGFLSPLCCLTEDPKNPLTFRDGTEILEKARRELRGKNLACWCALDQPCHADVLLELAND